MKIDLLQKQQVSTFSAQIGKDFLLVQGAGGNVSWKDEDTLWIKASGTWLAEAEQKDIFVPVDLKKLKEDLSQKKYSAQPAVLGSTTLRPSIETMLHALMPQKYVAHVHAIEALAYLVRNDFTLSNSPKLASNISPVLVSYQKPGADLASAVSDGLQKNPSANVVFLQNHGVVVGGASLEEVSGLISDVTLSFKCSASDFYHIEENDCRNAPTVPNYRILEGAIGSLAINQELYRRMQKDWALYPDHVVFLGEAPLRFDTIEAFQAALNESETPELAFVKSVGIFVTENFSLAKQEQLRCYYEVIRREKNHLNLGALSPHQIGELLNWDAEKYRQQLAK